MQSGHLWVQRTRSDGGAQAKRRRLSSQYDTGQVAESWSGFLKPHIHSYLKMLRAE